MLDQLIGSLYSLGALWVRYGEGESLELSFAWFDSAGNYCCTEVYGTNMDSLADKAIEAIV